MRSIDHLSKEEQGHYYKRDFCGVYVDMRSLSQVMEHEHDNLPKAEFDTARRVGDPEERINPEKGGGKINLN